MAPSEADIVVLGGGPAGATAAIALAQAGASVVLFERLRAPSFKPGEILESTIRYPLTELGLFERFEELGFLPIAGNLAVWGSSDPVDADGMLNPHGAGYLVDRARMEDWLIGEALRAGVTVVRGARTVLDAQGGPIVRWIEASRRMELRSSLIVHATGRSAGRLGPGRRQRFDALVALLAYLPEPPGVEADQRLCIEAVAEGWWYSATLPDKHRVVAFMTDSDLLPAGAATRLEFFNARLNETSIIQRPLEGRRPDSIKAHPATSTLRDTIAGPDWVALGDAAATYDPLSGRGVSAAMSKGCGLARAVKSYPSISTAGAAYARAEADAFADYLKMRGVTYGRERRWSHSSFWQRRH